jgi:hypothetical protein
MNFIEILKQAKPGDKFKRAHFDNWFTLTEFSFVKEVIEYHTGLGVNIRLLDVNLLREDYLAEDWEFKK